MLKSIVTNSVGSNMVIISDTLDQSGKSLLNCFLRAGVENESEIHIVCCENSPQKYKTQLDEHSVSRVQFHDDFSVYAEGNTSESLSSQRRRCDWSKLEEISKQSGNRNKVIIIDSLSLLCLRDGTVESYKKLCKLCNSHREKSDKGLQVVALFHRDAVIDGCSVLQKFSHLATTTLCVFSPVKNGGDNPIVKIIHKSPGGNVLKQIEEYKTDDSCHVSSVKITQQSSRNSAAPDVETQTLADLTFKLELSEKQKEARSQVKLPYLRRKVETETNAGGGRIFYEADSGDDLDEEDPDDDLNI